MNPIPCLIVLCCFAVQEKEEKPDVASLAKMAAVKLIVTPGDYSPPNTPIGIRIPYRWKVNSQSLDACRSVLKSISKPKRMHVNGPFEKSELKKLKALADEFEGLTIDRVPIVSIGVLCDSKTFEIARLMEGTSAEKSGLKRGDKIIKLDDSVIKSFEDLQMALCQFTPGDMVKLTAIRDGSELMVTIILSPRPGPKVDQ